MGSSKREEQQLKKLMKKVTKTAENLQKQREKLKGSASEHPDVTESNHFFNEMRRRDD